MKVYRQISDNWDKNQVEILHRYNIDVEEGIDRFNIYDLNLYKELKPLLDKWEVIGILGTEFTKKKFFLQSIVY